jgi:hypothetical protein
VAVAVSGRTITATRLAGDAPAAVHPITGAVGVTDGNTTASATSSAIPQNCP